MQGDLDHPPIIIRKSRVKSFLMASVSAILSFGAFLAWRDDQIGTSAWLMMSGFVMFALGVPLFASQISRPEQLLLSPAGLEWRSVRKTLTYRWDQLSEFSVFPLRGAKLIVFSPTGSAEPPKLAARINIAIAGNPAALPGMWEIKADQVAELLNSARSRWATRGTGG